jgi:hypothetical protein
MKRPWIAVFPEWSEGPVLQQNGPEERVEAGVSRASQGKADVGCVRRLAALSGQTERPCSLHIAGGGPKETPAGLSFPKTDFN